MTINNQNIEVAYNWDGSATDLTITFEAIDPIQVKWMYRDGNDADINASVIVSDVEPWVVRMEPGSAGEILIYRDTPITQETEYRAYDAFPAEAHENALDKLTQIDQEQQAQLDLTIQWPDGTDPDDVGHFLPDPEAGKSLKWNDEENALINSTYEVDEIPGIVEGYANSAANSANEAALSANEAALSATHAGESAQNALLSAESAANSAEQASDTWEEFNSLYLGSLASPPSTDNEGNPLAEGALYFNSSDNKMYVWDGSSWITTEPPEVGDFVELDNSDPWTHAQYNTLINTSVSNNGTPLPRALLGDIQAYPNQKISPSSGGEFTVCNVFGDAPTKVGIYANLLLDPIAQYTFDTNNFLVNDIDEDKWLYVRLLSEGGKWKQIGSNYLGEAGGLGGLESDGGESNNISLLGVKIADISGKGKYDLIDTSIDSFNDESGIDRDLSSGWVLDTVDHYVKGGGAGNYYGNSELGSVTFSSDSITQTGQTVNIDDVLSTGSSESGPGSSSYGGWYEGTRNADSIDSEWSSFDEDPFRQAFPTPEDFAARSIGVVTLPPHPESCYEATVKNSGNPIESYKGTIDSDGDMVVLQFENLTIDAGVTLTTKHPCKGLFIYVEKNCTIEGSVSMTCRGGNSDISGVHADGLQLPMYTTGGNETLYPAIFQGSGNDVINAVANQPTEATGNIFSVAKVGALGGPKANNPYYWANQGEHGVINGTTLQTGGGSSGASHPGNSTSGWKTYSGAGAVGGCFSGGTGGGAISCNNYGTGTGNAEDGLPNGGRGGRAASFNGQGGTARISGGAGNPGGEGVYGGSMNNATDEDKTNWGGDGTGGLVWLVVGGNLKVGNQGTVEARGQGVQKETGGPSGGGAVMTLYGKQLTMNGFVRVDGGVGYDYESDRVPPLGGDGTYLIENTGGSGPIGDLNLVSTSSTALSPPENGSIVLTYDDAIGVANLDTDIKAYISRDDGITWSNAPLEYKGVTEGHKILCSKDVSLEGQPSGTSMRYKIEALNQSESLETRIQSVSLKW